MEWNQYPGLWVFLPPCIAYFEVSVSQWRKRNSTNGGTTLSYRDQ
jgi:hypothetical protein